MYAVGNSLSLADVTIYSLITQFYPNNDNYIIPIAARIPRLRSIVMMVASRPEVIVWKQKRPKTIF